LPPCAADAVGYGWRVESVAGTNGDRPVAVRARPAALALKRSFDVCAAAAGLVVLSPVLAALAAVVLVEDGMPVLFRQERAGLDGEPFTILKFRTMIRDAHAHGDGFAVNEGDDRILRSGDFYRRYGLDELPQLWNVLRGEMSIIGPRPTLMEQVERYTPRQRVRLRMRPGVTGWSQIHGRTSIPWSRRIELDVWYVEHWSLRLDARILWRTLHQMTRPGETYKGATGGWDL
jgi:lipopolysaccharide/colanic/teichoic acid biosynthesis glycosyltransferase